MMGTTRRPSRSRPRRRCGARCRARSGAGGCWSAIADHSLLIAATIVFLAPFVFMVLTALMTTDQALSPKLWPDPFQWGNFAEVFDKAPMLRYALNTLLYSGLATLGMLVSSIPVAYALSRLRWRGRDAVVPARARGDDAAAAGHDRAALLVVGASSTWSARWRR